VRLLRSAFYALNALPRDGEHQPTVDIEIGEFYETLWIKLHHNGKCLSAEEQLDIFQPYFSLTTHSLTYPAEQRLSYSHFIITEHHRGQMAVTSNENHGTSFHIQLPMSS
jgi:K+-sensing histidine kinase KdpD